MGNDFTFFSIWYGWQILMSFDSDLKLFCDLIWFVVSYLPSAPNVEAAQKTFQAVYPRLLEFRKAKETVDISSARAKKAPAPDKSSAKRKKTNGGGVSLKAFQLPDDFKDFKEEIDSDDTDDWTQRPPSSSPVLHLIVLIFFFSHKKFLLCAFFYYDMDKEWEKRKRRQKPFCSFLLSCLQYFWFDIGPCKEKLWCTLVKKAGFCFVSSLLPSHTFSFFFVQNTRNFLALFSLLNLICGIPWMCSCILVVFSMWNFLHFWYMVELSVWFVRKSKMQRTRWKLRF